MFSTIGQCYFSPALMAQQPLVGQGLLWTSDQSDEETSDKTQHSQQTDHTPSWTRTHNPSKLAAPYTRLSQRAHWNRLNTTSYLTINS